MDQELKVKITARVLLILPILVISGIFWVKKMVQISYFLIGIAIFMLGIFIFESKLREKFHYDVVMNQIKTK